MQDIIYVPTPIEQKPEKDGPIYTITEGHPEQLGQWYYQSKGFNDDPESKLKTTHWLRPIPASEYKRVIAKAAFEACAANMKFKIEAIAPDLETYLNNL